MPAKPLTQEQKEDAARLKAAFVEWQHAQKVKKAPASQMEAASRLDFGQSALNQYLNGQIPLNAKVLAKFSELLGVKPETISPTISAEEMQRARTWSPTENALEQLALDLFIAAGVRARHTNRDDRKDLQVWFAEYLPNYTPDLRLDFDDGSVAWVEVKTPHAISPRAQSYVLAQAHHPVDFLLLMAEPPDMPRIIDGWLARRVGGEPVELGAHLRVAEPQASYGAPPRRVWVRGTTYGSQPEYALDDPAQLATEYAEVHSDDPEAFACRVVGDSMVPRYMPGEYVLIEPNTVPQVEDDVLVQLKNGTRMLKRLDGRRSGIRLGAYNLHESLTYQEADVARLLYVAHTIPPARIRKSSTSEAVGVTLSLPGVSVVKRQSAKLIRAEAEPGHPVAIPGVIRAEKK